MTNLNGKTITEIRDLALQNGFKPDCCYNYKTISYRDSKGRDWDIYLDPKKPNRVETLRVSYAKSPYCTGLIGKFSGGKGRHRKFSFDTLEQLKVKLEKWEL